MIGGSARDGAVIRYLIGALLAGRVTAPRDERWR
jgi:hypothetical protein